VPTLNEVLPKYAEAGNQGLLLAVDEIAQHGYLHEHIHEAIKSQDFVDDNQMLGYRHPNGFAKIRLATLPDYGWVVRVHLWDHPAADSDIHCHRWNFASRVLAGSLTEKTYAISAEGSGPWSKFSCHSERGSYSLGYLGQCDIALQEHLVYRAGHSYERNASTLHLASSETGSPTVTLFIQGAALQPATTVVRSSRSAERSDTAAQAYERDELAALLQRVLNILSGA